MIRITLRTPKELYEGLRKIVARKKKEFEKSSINSEIVLAIKEHVKKNK